MKKILLLLTLIIYACNNNLTSHGTNPENIAGFMDLETCKPLAVEYDVSHTGRASANLGPTDYTLEAVLYYDAAIFKRFGERYGMELAGDSPVTKATFNYTWLPKAVKEELAASPEAYVYRATALTKTGNPHCYLWFLNNKVLVYYFTM